MRSGRPTHGWWRAVAVVLVAAAGLLTVETPAGGGPAPTRGELTQKAGQAGCVYNVFDAGACVLGKALGGPRGVAVSPDGANVYAATTGSDGIAVFDRDATTGVLTQKAGTDGCVSSNQFLAGTVCATGTELHELDNVTVSPDGKSVYASASNNDTFVVFARNTSTGVLTQGPGTAGCISDDGTSGTCTDGTALDSPESVTVSPDGTNVYVASSLSNAVAVFGRNTTSGALTQGPGTAGCISDDGTSGTCTDGTALLRPNGVTVSPDGANVYVASSTSDAVSVFDRDTGTGALTQKAGLDACISDNGTSGTCTDGVALDGANNVAVAPDGTSLYVGAGRIDAVSVFDRDTTTGALTQKAGLGACISDDGTGGTCTDGVGLDAVNDLAISPDGANLYTTAESSDAIAVLDRGADGTLTQKVGTAGCVSEDGTAGTCQDGKAVDGPYGIAVSPDGTNVYTVAVFSNAVAVFDRTLCSVHPFSDVPPWVNDAVNWAWCDTYMTGYDDNTFRPDLSITRAQVARLLYRVAGSPDVSALPTHGFSDVPMWVEDAVRWMAANDYATGYDDDTFRPDIPISRAQVTRMQYRVAGEPPASTPHSFTDVPPWVNDAVDWIADPSNVPPFATGYDDNTYRPDLDITRAQVTRMTCRINTTPGTC